MKLKQIYVWSDQEIKKGENKKIGYLILGFSLTLWNSIDILYRKIFFSVQQNAPAVQIYTSSVNDHQQER